MPKTVSPSLEHRDPTIEGEVRYSDFSYKVDTVIYNKQSKYQDIKVYETKALGRVMTLDGVTQVTEADEFVYHEMLTHIPMSYHPNPKNVLIIGGGDGGTLREVEKYKTLDRITLCEIDEEVINTAKKFFPTLSKDTFNDARLTIELKPAEEFIQTAKDQTYDVIINDSTEYNADEPISELLFGEPFYQQVKRVLKKDGVFATLGLDLTPEYEAISKFNQKARTTVQNRIKKIFSNIYTHYFPAYAYGWPFMGMFVSQNNKQGSLPELETIKQRVSERNLKNKYYTYLTHASSCIDPQVSYQSVYAK
jgi:spermidine synthase